MLMRAFGATVIGASQYTVQLSGETIHVPEAANLPVRNLGFCKVHVDWESPVAARAETAVKKALRERDLKYAGSPFRPGLSSPPFLGYGAAQEPAKGHRSRVGKLPIRREARGACSSKQNIGRSRRRHTFCEMEPPLHRRDQPYLSCDFIDVGEVVEGEGFVPVVVKSLAFGV